MKKSYNYLIESNDSASIRQKRNDLIEQEKFKDATISTYDLEETSLENALEDLDTYSLFTEKKVIIIFSIENIKIEENEKYLKHLYKYLDHPKEDNLLIICCKKLNHASKLYKELSKRMECLKISINLNDWIKKELSNYQLENNFIPYLIDSCQEDFTKIETECKKLKNYRANELKLTIQDIDDLVIKKLGDSTELTFSFVRNLGEKKKEKALVEYKELLAHQIDPISIVGLVASQIRIIYQVKLLEKRNLSNDEIGKILGEKSYRVKKTRELTNFYSENELRNLMISLGEIDLKIKTTDIDPNFLIELFILNI